MLALPVSNSSVLSSSIPLTYVRALSLPSSVGVCGESMSMLEVFIAVEELEREMALDDPDPED